MRRVIGFALFFIAIGMIIQMMITDLFVCILLIFIFMLLGYNLFYC